MNYHCWSNGSETIVCNFVVHFLSEGTQRSGASDVQL